MKRKQVSISQGGFYSFTKLWYAILLMTSRAGVSGTLFLEIPNNDIGDPDGPANTNCTKKVYREDVPLSHNFKYVLKG